MKILFVILFCFFSARSFSQNRLNSHIFGNIGLRENENLIFQISELRITHCSQCNVQLTKYSYTVKIKDAFLKVNVRNTSRGPLYTPFLDTHIIDEKGSYTWDLPEPIIPEEGLYIGNLHQVCAPWAIMANGDCREYQIKYKLLGRVVAYK